ncbi:hypothetical protein M441DRAFT_316564 [Trichoderma asperellum CBS 433.97]|uniref:Uncharacterized protein n=1 Tax=Trichoderma asperellum (strain ATCC 204424 / CBS 433.97 / NBRC 101777) TaxID=1042311 RepID=A0A2T3ZKS3_TRIA4|nr:hypothetical protein M441DRAFT_316564 [Trichoderma asperellum CBS 433.97]PTB45399.1 hypothetical protein M441DRAFT_316564 [Trichoderma asperellum CBS 433.97]
MLNTCMHGDEAGLSTRKIIECSLLLSFLRASAIIFYVTTHACYFFIILYSTTQLDSCRLSKNVEPETVAVTNSRIAYRQSASPNTDTLAHHGRGISSPNAPRMHLAGMC